MKSDRHNTVLVIGEHFNALADPNLYPSCLQMPNLRRLAETGTCFRQVCCSAPVSGPSRMSMLTGLNPCHHGAYDNGSTLPSHIPTYAHILNAAGIETAICGRMHIHGLDYYKGFEHRLATEMLNPSIEQPPDWPAPHETIPPLPEGPIPIPEFSDAPPYKHDEYVTQKALEFLETHRSPKRPFHLTVGYAAAHPGSRRNPAYRKWLEYYLNRSDLPIAPFNESDYENLPENARRLLSRRTTAIFDKQHVKKELAILFAGLSFLDEQLGLLLDSLETNGLRESTVLCFTADHGENMGRHGLWGKMNFYEEAVRVPLYFSGPGIASGRVVDAPASLNDLLPTLAEFSGATPDIPLDGVSLAPTLLSKIMLPANRPIYSEYHGYLSVCGGYMLRKNDWKLVHYPMQEDELYDLKNDPGEMNNLATCVSHAKQYQSMLTELDAYFHVTETETKITEYNHRRNAVLKGISSSAVTCERLIKDIEKLRTHWNEPWWDDSEFFQQYDAHLYQHRT